MSSCSWSAAPLPIRTGPEPAIALQVVELVLCQVGTAVDPVHDLQRPVARPADSRKRSVSQPMNASASSVKPRRSSAYSVKAASRIQV